MRYSTPAHWRYFSLLETKESLAMAIDRLLFAGHGELHNEYKRLFASLFKRPEPYLAIVKTLAQHRYGLTRSEIASVLKISDGGTH